MTDLLDELRRWYAAHCDGDWEHRNGITIQTLDNPGWQVTVNLAGTRLKARPFPQIREQIDLKDHPLGSRWLHCSIKDGTWRGAGDETKLSRILETFLDWSREVPNSAKPTTPEPDAIDGWANVVPEGVEMRAAATSIRDEATAREVFLAWERLRIEYNGVLAVASLIGFAGHLRSPTTWMMFAGGAIGANICFSVAPCVEGYLAWFGLPRRIARPLIFGAGLLLSLFIFAGLPSPP